MTMTEDAMCVFCNLASKKIPSTVLYEDQELFAFKDAYPKAPVHLLIIPKKHLENHLELKEEHCSLIGKAHLLANQLAHDHKIDKEGFRLIVNCGEKGGQTVNHLHMHVMGGRDFQWPPG